MDKVNVGDVVTCAETGRQFTVARDGVSFNYARSSSGEILSDEGVDIRQRRELQERAGPFGCYLSSDGRSVTGWKGNELGTVVDWSEVQLTRRSYTHGKFMRAVTVQDVHGGLWYGRGSPGLAITLRPRKTPL